MSTEPVQREDFKDLWTVALEEKKQADLEKKRSSKLFGLPGDEEAHVLFLGSRSSGKTTMILRFLEREEAAKPTVALDYTFGRRSRGTNMAKNVAHLWELGGGTFLSKLMEVAITMESISNLVVVVMLDLSKPELMWDTLEVLLKELRQCIEKVFAESKSSHPDLAKRLRRRAWRRYGDDHPDKELLSPLPVPLAIVGGKYDLFQDFDPEKKKMISKTLRFLAHTNGATLQYFSMKMDGLVNRARQLITHFAFTGPISQAIVTDHNKPLLVPVGSDFLGQIGAPSLSDGDLGTISAKNPLELWKQAYCGFFPQRSAGGGEVSTDDPCKSDKYKEMAVDAMRAQKDEELERYRKESERKARRLSSLQRPQGKHGQKAKE